MQQAVAAKEHRIMMTNLAGAAGVSTGSGGVTAPAQKITPQQYREDQGEEAVATKEEMTEPTGKSTKKKIMKISTISADVKKQLVEERAKKSEEREMEEAKDAEAERLDQLDQEEMARVGDYLNDEEHP